MNFLKKLIETITTQIQSDSKSGHLNSTDFVKTIRDFAFVSGAAGVAFLLEKVPSLNLGEYTPVLVPILTLGLTAAMRFLRDNQSK